MKAPMLKAALAACVLLPLAACESKQEPKPAAPRVGGATVPAPAPAAAPAAPSAVFAMSAKSPHAVGRFEGTTLRSAKGESGMLHFGPYVALQPGAYRVTFDVRSDAPAGVSVGKADVNIYAAGKGDNIVATAPILGQGSGTANIDFEAREGVQYEFRVWVNGDGPVELGQIRLFRR